MRRIACLSLLAFAAVFLIGCPKGNQEYDAGRKAEDVQDYDTALVHYERALQADPTNAEYKLRALHTRFQDGQFHVEQGQKALKKGDLRLALAEFQKAQAIDPSNAAADQQVRHTMDLLRAQNAAESRATINPNPPDDGDLLSAPPELKPLSREPINLKMTNDARIVFETIAKLAGLSVIFDPDFTSRRISAELPNVTLEQALDAVALESKAFWKPLTSSVILVAPDNPQKRRELEDEVVRTFYLSNTLTPQSLTEIVTGLRQLLDLRRVQQVNAQNAIVVRDTPDKLALAAKIIRDIDKAKPEVLIHVQVLTASMDRLRDLGILPGQSSVLTFNPRSALQPGGGSTGSTGTSGSSTSAPQVTLNNLQHLSTADWSLTLPGATATAILTDNKTRIIQDPEVRVSDGEKATLKIGDRVPVATGSFQAGVGVGVGGGAGVVNPLVNTQFQYIDVGVNIDVTPRVHPDGDVSLKLSIEVSSITGSSNIGGINQPVISQRKIEHDIRLKDGEVNVLGGLIERTETKNVNGIPGVAQLPLFRYLFSDNSKEVKENEVLIVLTPHVLRMPSITADNLRTVAAGTDTNVRVYREGEEAIPSPATMPTGAAQPPAAQPSAQAAPSAAPAAQLHFQPASATLKPGDRTTLGLAVSNVSDLYSIPLLIHYDPAVVQVEEVRNGGFLSGGTQEIAIVQRIDQQRGEVIVSATRQPNTPGVNGSGTLLGIVVRAVAPGTSTLQILQVNARDSQQRTIPMVSGVATIQVQ
ncbi:MAG TPA: cohesin domain-containing protein [Candidatus Polarisedimenticolia bacterium]|nr:cohesin domain-containing protein [Candidatus Polarisedimenticolia bacterium]